MSLVAEVLSSIKQRSGVEGSSVAGDGMCVKVAELAKRAGEAKVAVIHALEEQYVQLCMTLQDTTLLQTRVNHNLDQLKQLQSSLDCEVAVSVAHSVGAVSNVASRWKQAVEALDVSQQLLAVHEELKRANKEASDGKYFEAAKSLNKVEDLLSDVDADVDILPGIVEEVLVRRNSLIYDLSNVWAQAFRWEEEMQEQEKKKTLTLHIRCGQASQLDDDSSGVEPAGSSEEAANSASLLAKDLKQVLAALNMLEELLARLNKLCHNLLNNFFKAVLTRPAKVALRECGDTFAISVTFSTAPDRGRQPTPLEVYSNLGQILKCLHATGFGLEFETGENREDGSSGTTTLMKLLGQQVGSDMSSLLISECLAAAVPCSRKNLDEFDDVKDQTNQFHAMLVSLGFFSESEASILEYAANVDSTFSTKACAHLLDTTRELITRPLHDTVTIQPQEGYPPLAIQDESGVRLEKSTLRLEKLLAAKTFHMPHCKVSKSICDLIELLYETMEEACTSSPQYAGRLVCTVRNMLSLYEHVTPVVHASTLQTIPQHAALVHNNSMYISTHCYLLSHQYRSRLPAELREAGPCAVSFTDLSHQITATGTQVFYKAMQGHKRALLDTIGHAQGFGEVPSDVGVRQCLHQLQQLRNVWHDVLPHSVYSKAMATLLNSVVHELVERTLSLEDISQDAAVALTATLAIIKDNGPVLFPAPSVNSTVMSPPSSDTPREGVCLVREWGRFLELVVVLGASLRELQDRWAEGRGPLALYYTADQAKALVRALFQNTDRRAALLARIKLQ